MTIQGVDGATDGRAHSGAGLILAAAVALSILAWTFWGWIY